MSTIFIISCIQSYVLFKPKLKSENRTS